MASCGAWADFGKQGNTTKDTLRYSPESLPIFVDFGPHRCHLACSVPPLWRSLRPVPALERPPFTPTSRTHPKPSWDLGLLRGRSPTIFGTPAVKFRRPAVLSLASLSGEVPTPWPDADAPDALCAIGHAKETAYTSYVPMDVCWWPARAKCTCGTVSTRNKGALLSLHKGTRTDVDWRRPFMQKRSVRK